MKSFKPRGNRKLGPEAKIQDDIMAMLRVKEWLVKSTHGNIYSYGFPDIYAAHKLYGARWIEIKVAEQFSFTNAQLEFFPMLQSVNIGVWVLTMATEEEYQKLFRPPNWTNYLSVWRNYRK